jgi:putative membrane protein
LQVNVHPANQLAITRTILANERTLQAFLRTALGCFIGGAGLIKFFGHPIYEIIGTFLVIICIVVAFIGIRKYRMVKKLISDIDPEDWQVVERTTISEME